MQVLTYDKTTSPRILTRIRIVYCSTIVAIVNKSEVNQFYNPFTVTYVTS